MKKIIFVVTSLNAGGIENYLLRFLKHYDGQIFPIIVCKNGLGGELQSEYRKISNISFYEGSVTYFNAKLFKELLDFFKATKPNAICDFTGNFGGIPLWLAKIANIPTRIAFYRGSTDHFSSSFFKNNYNQTMKKMVLKYATDILANSESGMKYFFDNHYKNDKRFQVIYNGIDADKFLTTHNNLRDRLGIIKEAFVVGHVGRFNPAKNHQTIINVAENLIKADSNIVFLLCGKNVDLELRDWVIANGYEKNVKLLGYTKNVIEVLNSVDCFFFPSITEGHPNALIEALIVGLPFVASNIDPIKEVIPSDYDSQLVEPNDYQSACQRIIEIKDNQQLRNKLNLSNWAKANFDADKLFDKFFQILNTNKR